MRLTVVLASPIVCPYCGCQVGSASLKRYTVLYDRDDDDCVWAEFICANCQGRFATGLDGKTGSAASPPAQADTPAVWSWDDDLESVPDP